MLPILSFQLSKLLGINVKKTEISQTEVDELEHTNIAVIVPYTISNGSLPDEGLDFFDDLAQADLSGVVYGGCRKFR